MTLLDKIILFISLTSLIGTITTSYFSDYSNAITIGLKEMKNLNNVTNINIDSNIAYLYTNSTERPEFKYNIGNDGIFNDYLKNNSNLDIEIKYDTKLNIYKLILFNLPTIIFLYIMVKSISMQTGMFNGSFIKSLDKDSDKKINFEDIAGLKEVKEDVEEFIDILKGNEKFKKMKCKIPRGALFYGPPGTGKTLIAKAIAQECKTEFIHVSGSSFNEIYVGVGQSRVRKLFEKARKMKPCIIFIDEIDTLGKRRSKMSEGHNEHENTLNSLLAEMDGMDSNDSILIFGATNRPQMLDSALTRPGRFDRKIEFSLPTLEERSEILKLYLNKYPVSDDLENIVKNISEITYGFSGADLSNLCNEAAIKSVRNKKEKIDLDELNNAISYIMVGSKRESSKLLKSDKVTVAHHEAGHAFMSYIQKDTESPCKVSIIPTTKGALGFSMSNQREKKLSTKNELLQQMSVMIGGRCSESIFLDDITTGASDDLEKLRNLAKAYICVYGFSDKLGNLNIMNDDVSEKMKQLVDNNIQNLIENVYKYTNNVLNENKEEVKKLVTILLKKEEINKNDIKLLLGKKLESSIKKFS
tara:strand:+ start:1581 stop:3335 length:1755 start_codon:yes stop_codon:yes gene_type:complete